MEFIKIKSLPLITVVLVYFIVTFTIIIADTKNPMPDFSLQRTECNSCHGISHPGHVSFTVSLEASETILNGTETIVTVTIINKDFPLSSSSFTLTETSNYHLATSQTAKRSLGTIGRGKTVTEKFTIIASVSTNTSIPIQGVFVGTARDHKVHTYKQQVTKNVFVSVVPTPLLFVSSTFPSGTTFLKGEKAQGVLNVSNVGTLAMDNVVIEGKGIKINGSEKITLASLKPKEVKSFVLSVDTSQPGNKILNVSYSGTSTRKTSIQITVVTPPPTPLPVLIGRVLGYAGYIFLFVSVVFGIAKRQLKRFFSGRKIRILHADISNIGFTLVIIHAISLAIPNSPWAETYLWFDLFPVHLPNSLQTLGLELGRLGLLVMYISVISGTYFSKIVKKFGRKAGIRIHMLSYIALVGGVVHAIIIGGTASKWWVTFLLLASLVATVVLKWDDQRLAKQKRAKRKAKRITDEKKTIKRVPSIKIATDVRTGSMKTIGLLCWKCDTLNDDDANYCKRCGIKLEGIICPSCNARNKNDATVCITCSTPLQGGNKK